MKKSSIYQMKDLRKVRFHRTCCNLLLIHGLLMLKKVDRRFSIQDCVEISFHCIYNIYPTNSIHQVNILSRSYSISHSGQSFVFNSCHGNLAIYPDLLLETLITQVFLC